MVQGLISKQHSVFNENSTGSQDKGGEQVDVNVVSSAAEFSEKTKQKERRIKTHMYTDSTLTLIFITSLLNIYYCENSLEATTFE